MVSQICITEIKLFKVVAAEVSRYLGQTPVLRITNINMAQQRSGHVVCESEVSSYFLNANVGGMTFKLFLHLSALRIAKYFASILSTTLCSGVNNIQHTDVNVNWG